MVGLFAFVALLAAPQTEPYEWQRFDELISLAGPQNGYGDYVRAVKALRAVDFKPRKPGEVEAARIDLARFDDVIRSICTGNAKPVALPDPKPTMLTLQPELIGFRDATRLLVEAAEVAFADGDSGRAVDSLGEAWKFADKAQYGTMINALIGMSMRRIVLREIDLRWSKLTHADLGRISGWASSSLAGVPAIRFAAKADRKQLRDSFDGFLAEPKDAFDIAQVPSSRRAEIANGLRSLTPAQRQNVYAFTLVRFESSGRAVAVRLDEPEARWLKPLKVETYAPPSKPPPREIMKMGAGFLAYLRLVTALGPPFEDGSEMRSIEAAARERVRLRILRVSAAVGQWRLAHGRLPDRLSEVFGKSPIEPMTGKFYVYQRLKHQKGFRVSAAVAGAQVALDSRR